MAIHNPLWVSDPATRFWGIPRQARDEQTGQVFGEFHPDRVIASLGDHAWGAANRCEYVGRDLAFKDGVFALATYPPGCAGVAVWEETTPLDVRHWLARYSHIDPELEELVRKLAPLS
jgi:hypothetical protein